MKRAAMIAGVAAVALAIGVVLLYRRDTRMLDRNLRLRISHVALTAWNPAGEGVRYFEGSVSRSRVRVEPLTLDEFPPSLRNAVIAVEDHRFYDHFGIDWRRTAMAAWQGIGRRESPRATSSLSQQLARNLYLDTERTYRRKVREGLLAIAIERSRSKNEILELYLNAVPMGHRATYDLVGMGAAAREFFGKPASELTAAQSALLAAMIQQPSTLNPRRRPAAAQERRNLVLALMRRWGYLGEAEYRAAVREPLGVVAEVETQKSATTGLYFVDTVRRELERAIGSQTVQAGRLEVATTLDPRLQAIAEEVVSRMAKRMDPGSRAKQGGRPEIALVALDARTGAVRALVGGRNYAKSQINHAFAQRQPGSTFKPFVYAAALDRAVQSRDFYFNTFTPVDDTPTTFVFNGSPYQPANYHGSVNGPMPARQALALSSNVAAVRVATMTGYDRIATLAKNAGLESTGATPSAALGSYEASPLQLAGAYTAFSNGGLAVRPYTVERVMDRRSGGTVYSHNTAAKPVMNPISAYLVTSMLEDVITYGTGFGVRQAGFRLPVAGKTGTDDDGWFAGFTSELLCVVWVGYDDNRNLGIEGGKSALPIWVDFMKQASQLAPYKRATTFQKPAGADRFVGWPAPDPPPIEPLAVDALVPTTVGDSGPAQ